MASKALQAQMRTMRNAHAPHIDFGEFKGLIKTSPKVLPSDIDMIYERRSQFLVCEWKRNGESISTGQLILLRNLAALPNFNVLIIHGNTDEETLVSEVEWIKQGELVHKGDSLDDLKRIIIEWYEFADGGYA